MSWTTPKRVYSPSALEYWLEKLAVDWEPHFSREALARGRDLYRNGAIREVQLDEGQAIIHMLEDRQPHYAVVEWEDNAPRFRHSTPDRTYGHALAAAGLYEVEELVADEIDPLPRETNGHAKPADLVAESEEPPPPPPPDRPARKLLLRLTLDEHGLAMRASWQVLDGQNIPLHQTTNAQLLEAEREAYIRFASRARRAGFEPDRQRVYRLGDPERLAGFVREHLPLWRKRFVVEAPPEVAHLAHGLRDAAVAVHADASSRGARFRWTVYVDHDVVPPAEAKKILTSGRRHHFIPGYGAVRLRTDQADALSAFPSLLHDDGTGDVPAWMIFSLFGQSAIPVQLSDSLESWKQQLLEAPAEEADLPLLSYLRAYQRRGVGWFERLGSAGCHGLLADEMGLGKTLQAASILAARPVEGLPSLVVCPASVVPVWQNELARHFPDLRVEVLGTGHDFALVAGADVWLASYTQLRRHRHLLGSVRFGYAILDEAQAIKNPEAKSAQTCCAIRATHRFALTGTPLENRPLDLWSLFRFLMPGLLGTRSVFEARMKDDPADGLPSLRRQLAPFLLRRTKADVAPELPPKVEIDLACPLSPRQRTEYTRLAEEGVREIGDDVSAALRERTMNFLSLLTRLRQTCCDPGLLPWLTHVPVEESGKIMLLLDKLEAAFASGHKVVVFSQFVSLLDRLRPAIEARYPESPLFWLTGSTLDRDRPVREFQERDGAAVFLLSLKAGGTGITLHAADTVFLLDPWWNPAVENQAIDRVHRIGQDKRVVVYRLVTNGTVEARVQALKEEKREIFDATVGNLDDVSRLASFTRSMRDLVGLAPDEKPLRDAVGGLPREKSVK